MGTGLNLQFALVLWMISDLLQRIFVCELAGNEPAAVEKDFLPTMTVLKP